METLGRYVARKWRLRLRAHPVKFNIEQPGAGNTLARQMCKQGYSLDMALLALLGRRERYVATHGMRRVWVDSGAPHPRNWPAFLVECNGRIRAR